MSGRGSAALFLALALSLALSGCGGESEARTDPVPANTYAAEDFVEAGGFLTYVGDGPSAVGVDVSSYQGEIDWEAVADAGVEFAIIRAGYRGYTEGGLFEDVCYRQNMDGALAAGLEVGAYFFSQAIDSAEAAEEARFVLDLLEGYEVTYPVVFDWERQDADTSRTSQTDGDTQTACAAAFCQTIEGAGYLPMVYFSPSKGYNELDLEQLAGWPFWLAHYTDGWSATSFKYHFVVWQYAQDGAVDGITGKVDLNLCLTDWSAWGQTEP
jgi:GH25 family lysozyme M1 (1,4-beta-N-acetylmuramidase)